MFFETGTTEILEIWIWNLWTLLCIWKSGNSSRKNMFLQNTLAAGTSGIWEIGTFSDIFFPKCHKFAKKCKTQNAKVSRKHLKFGVLSKRLWRFVEALKKCRKWHRNPRAHSCTLFFRNSARAFWGFRDFQLRIEVKFRKRLDVFLEKFSLLRFTAGGRRPHLHGAKIWTFFFRKVRNTFSVLGPILLLLLEKIRPEKRRLQITL
jgi:hypothetical protein